MRRASTTLGILLLCAACERPAGPDSAPAATGGDPEATGWFHDVTAASGLEFLHDAGLTEEKHLPETMGGGGALADLDGDGDLDIYLVQSGPLPLAGRVPGPRNALYLNDGRGRFRDASATSGDAAHDGYGMGVTAGDVDGDGDVDLFVTNLGPDVLLINDGGGVFTDATPPLLADPRWTSGASLFDADGDGDLDLYVSAYVEVDMTAPRWCGDRQPGYRSYCHPDVYPGLSDRFYRNEGGGRFVDATAQAGFAVTPDMPGKGLGVLATDIDADGDLDLYVANDSVENRLWVNEGDGTFSDATLFSGTGTNGRGMTEAGMGLASGDADGDGDMDIFVTNFDDESNTLYRNDGGGLFTDATVVAGLEAATRHPVGFGCVMADLDDDGDLDLAVTNGHIIDNVQLYDDGKTHAQRSQMFTNDGRGVFTEATDRSGALAAELFVGRGLYAGDLDADGDLDLLLTQCGGPARLLRNDGAPGASLVVGGLPPGTRVVATTASGRERVRETGQQVSYFGACAPELHLGLGDDGDPLVSLEVAVPGRPARVFPLPESLRSGRWAFSGGPDELALP